MLRFVFLVLALCGSQAFGQTCADYESCVKNMTNLDVTWNEFRVGIEDDLINAPKKVNRAVKEFQEKVADGPEECKYLSVNISRTLLYSCGVQLVGVGDEINVNKGFLDSLPQDIKTADISKEQREDYCKLYVENYNLSCKRLKDGLDKLRECNLDKKVKMFTYIWLHCTGNFKE